MKAIKTRRKILTQSSRELRRKFAEFYQSLYKEENKNISRESLGFKIEESDRLRLKEEISLEEIENVVKSFKSKKSPGLDGITADFYKETMDILGSELKKVFNNILEGGKAPDTWKLAEIVVIEKPQKDPTEVGSYRPISLLNQDYKIFTKILARRLEKLLPKIIKEDQYGFVKGRYIGHPTRNV